ncbi:MAG: FGGY-family carbohydrate kinase, partial [Actinomycetes bacterium]
MGGALVVGVDLGLSGIRVAVMDEVGNTVAASSRYPISTSSEFGTAQQDPSDWLVAMSKASQEVAASIALNRIEAIGVSAFGPAPILVDAALNPITPALLFSLDSRAEKQRARVAGALGLSDYQLNHDHAIPKLLWWKETHPEIWSRSAWALDAAGFIVSQLTGHPTMDQITAFDYSLEGFDSPIRVPAPTDPLAKVGGLTANWSKCLGFPAGTPVLTGTYDAYADTAATGTMKAGDGCVILGTTLIIGVVAAHIPADLAGLVSSTHLGEGSLVGGWTSSGCSALSWARRLIGVGQDFYDELHRDAASLLPGDGGLIFLPYLAGERSPVHDPAARGLLMGLTADTRPAQIYRAVADGLALSIRDHQQRLAEIGIHASIWRAGGGGSRNDLLVQATSDALGEPVEV